MLDDSQEAAVLPPLFASWIRDLLPGPIPKERAATCDTCAMVRPAGAAVAPGESFFSPSTKCCTYLPDLSNFLVGRVLADRDPDAAHGRTTVEARIDRRVGVTPLGLHWTPVYGLLYQTSPASFGHAESMRCPHYLEEGGRCGVWRHRESTCATWFCKYGRGAIGLRFWQRLQDTLAAAEEAVRISCVLELGIDPRTLARIAPARAMAHPSSPSDGLSASAVDGTVDDAAYRALWGDWHGRERDLFLACAERTDGLLWADVARLGGAKLDLASRLLVEAYRQLTSGEIPLRARSRELRMIHVSAESAHLVGYSALDALRVPKKLVDVLHCFDGRPTGAVLDDIDERHALRVSPGAVRKLVDFGVLEADDAEATDAGAAPDDGSGHRATVA